MSFITMTSLWWTSLDMSTLPLKSSHKEQPSVSRLLWAKGLSANSLQSWDASSIWWQVFYKTSNKVCSWLRKCCWWGRTWSLCCFDDRCNDRNGQVPHAVKPACYGINVYMNLDVMLKNETLCLTFKHICLLDLFTFSFNSQCCSTLASCKRKLLHGQNTAQTDCVLSTSDVTIMMSSS